MTAFVICSRLSSSRLPSKPLIKYNGIPQIELLIRQLTKSNLKIFVAVPESEAIQYSFLVENYKNVTIFTGNEDDPLARMYLCATTYGIKNIIRVTHDKMFINLDVLNKFIELKNTNDLDYIYSSEFTPGTGFELISFDVLQKAAQKFTRVEHISYAIKAVTKKTLNYRFKNLHKNYRLLVDYKEDVDFMNVIIATLGTDIDVKKVTKFLNYHHRLNAINKLPEVTIYTCAKNAGKWIEEAMQSVANQKGFKNFEYILIDDYSTDKTLLHMANFCQEHKNTRFIRNQKNIGLASSSNLALKNAKGKYIIRLDADDFFISDSVVKDMVHEMDKTDCDALYPNCYAGLSRKFIQLGKENHHVGGSMFRTSAINHIKFTDGLMNYDSLDLFARAKDILNIAYYDKITFCYRQHNESMSKNNLEERKKIRRIIEEKYMV